MTYQPYTPRLGESLPRRRVAARTWPVVVALVVSLLVNGFTPARAAELAPDPLVSEMIAQVQPQAVYAYTGGLSGEWPVWVGGQQYRILTRATYNTIATQNATQYVYEQLESLGLPVGYQDWTYGSLSGRNVTGELPGATHPDELILLTAHLDDVPWSGTAPGADDNASGCTALLLAAHILTQYHFDRTLRFVFFTGEEQGLRGSYAYAHSIYALGENVSAVLNMDMIGWDDLDGPLMRLHTRALTNSAYPLDAAIANAFITTVETYGLGGAITPLLDPDGKSNSDHASFWGVGYPAIFVSEDNRDDFNDYYHSRNDRLSALNLPYFTAIVQAVVGTAAGLAGVEGRAAGDYAARLEPVIAEQTARNGASVSFTLHVTNSGALADAYTVTVAGSAWLETPPALTEVVAPGDGADLAISFVIPAGAPDGAADIARVTLVSQGTGEPLDEATLTSVADWQKYYLPVVGK